MNYFYILKLSDSFLRSFLTKGPAGFVLAGPLPIIKYLQLLICFIILK